MKDNRALDFDYSVNMRAVRLRGGQPSLNSRGGAVSVQVKFRDRSI